MAKQSVSVMRAHIQELESKLADVMAGCDIRRGDVLCRQVPVVIGPGLTQPELDLMKERSRQLCKCGHWRDDHPQDGKCNCMFHPDCDCRAFELFTEQDYMILRDGHNPRG